MLKFKDIIKAAENKLVNFYGVDDSNCFKLGRVVFEALAEPADGYYSRYDDQVLVCRDSNKVFSETPLAQVYVREQERDYFRGYILVDEYGHTWLKFGTDSDNEDGYFPFFVFKYTPSTYTNVIDALFER